MTTGPLDRLETPLVGGTAIAPVLDLPRRRLDFRSGFAVMAIVNRTQDSFYAHHAGFGEALDHARQVVDEGADVIDVGAVKAGPGREIDSATEIERVAPFVAALRGLDSSVLISVDTFRADVAAAALDAGADIVNDTSGMQDPGMLDVLADRDAGYVAMHMGGVPRRRPYRPDYVPDVTTTVVAHLAALTARLEAAGVSRSRVIVDPGHDFNKNTWHSLEVTRRLPEIAALGHPVLVALSNKDFIGESIAAPIDGRVNASLAAAVFSVLRGANIVRVHEVAATVEAMAMIAALLGMRSPVAPIRGLE